jgi:peptidoglycan/LPS O-acetylase OafA/YrhL
MGTLRFLLALCVVAHHTGPLFGLTPLSGSAAVRIFFGISGFYMAMVLTTKYRDHIRVFWFNRALRLYPAYILFVGLTWGWYFFTWMWLGRRPTGDLFAFYAAMAWWQPVLLFFSDWTMIGRDIQALLNFEIGKGFIFPGSSQSDFWVSSNLCAIPQAWSLGTEMWFYLFVPWLVLCGTVTLIVIAVFSALLDLTLQHRFGFEIGYFFFPSNLYFFIAGMLAFRAMPHYRHLPTWLLQICVASCAALLVFWNLLWLADRWIIAYVLIIPMLPALFRATEYSGLDSLLGNLSYPIYLCHVFVAKVTLNVTKEENAYVVLAATLLISFLCYKFVEDPIDRWRRNRTASRS